MSHYQVIWVGPVLGDNGIGTASREYVLALHRLGVHVKVTPARRRSSFSTPSKRLMLALARRPLARKKPKVLVYHRLPHTLNITQARKKYDYLILNAVWETTKIPRSWLPNINRFDAVCVPSVQNRIAMKRSGVRVPVYIVPHGVNSRAFNPRNKKLSLKKKDAFLFVSVFTFQHRKNPETLLRAFWEEFSARDRAALLIKTSGFSARESGAWIRGRIAAYKKKLGIRHKTAPLHLLTGSTSPRTVRGVYTAGDAFVLPTRGEGVGLPFLESLASGTPVIVTGWGGHMDFVTRANSFLVPYKLKPPAAGMNKAISRSFRRLFVQEGQLWAEPDLGSLKKQMRRAYEHPELCRRKGLRGRRDMSRWTWTRAGHAMKRAIEKTIASKRRR
ncbi:glycosyltransferase family 4 protein [Paenibacillus chitinolyticus]|uniref:glycosyltransferase family 4 protein n=1 Tax=Paenibacillus chitinolyticus TaxID=79263 RepID=UPI0035DEF9AB